MRNSKIKKRIQRRELRANIICALLALTLTAISALTIKHVINTSQPEEPIIPEEPVEEIFTPAPDAQATVKYDDIGTCLVTHYCTCAKCCGKTNGITASGTVATPHRTAAVDPKVIPLGSVLFIDGIYYIAEDTGGAIKGNRVDICVSTHEEAINAGVKAAEVFVVGLEPVD